MGRGAGALLGGLVVTVVGMACGSVPSSSGAPTTSPSAAPPSPSATLTLSGAEHLALSGAMTADVAAAVVAGCPDTPGGHGLRGLRLVFDGAGRRWDMLVIIASGTATGVHDLSDPAQATLALDVFQSPPPSLLSTPRPGPVDHFNAVSGTFSVDPADRTGTVRASLANAQIGPPPVSLPASPPPVAVIEHIDGTWSC